MELILRAFKRRIDSLKKGQATIELALAFPLLLAVALFAYNALSFCVSCAQFDRTFRNAVRVYATAPAYEQTSSRVLSEIQSETASSLDSTSCNVTVTTEGLSLGLSKYNGCLTYTPTLFGMSFAQTYIGISLPKLTHINSFVVDSFKPGVII